MSKRQDTLSRRSLMGLAVAGSVSAIAPGIACAGVARQDQAKVMPAGVAGGMRMNPEEAARVMRALNIDALVLGDGRNFQYATGFQPVVSKMGLPPINLVIVPANDPTQVIPVMAGFSYYYTSADSARFTDLDVFLYGGSPDPESPAVALGETVFNDYGDTALRHIEQNRVDQTRRLLNRSSMAKEQGAALLGALKQAGVDDKRLAFDSPAVAALLARSAPKATCVDADDALRRIRTIKSPLEIELMRQSSDTNIRAAHAALRRCGPGVTHRELRAYYYSEVALRGGKGVFMVIDHVSDEQFDATLSDGQAFLIDCVCDQAGYLGDYGRTVFMGEPQMSLLDAQRAVASAWSRVREALKPGITFSKITEMGQRAMREKGLTYRVPFYPHSVGMFHTDHMGNGSSAAREDIVLRAGMTLSIDCPIMHSGIGGSVHLEDLMLITETGCEPLHQVGDSTIQI